MLPGALLVECRSQRGVRTPTAFYSSYVGRQRAMCGAGQEACLRTYAEEPVYSYNEHIDSHALLLSCYAQDIIGFVAGEGSLGGKPSLQERECTQA